MTAIDFIIGLTILMIGLGLDAWVWIMGLRQLRSEARRHGLE